jgi:hypothetical protein
MFLLGHQEKPVRWTQLSPITANEKGNLTQEALHRYFSRRVVNGNPLSFGQEPTHHFKVIGASDREGLAVGKVLSESDQVKHLSRLAVLKSHECSSLRTA